MIKVLLFDFARVILFPKDVTYSGKLSDFYRKLTKQPKSIFHYYKFNTELLSSLEKYSSKYQLAILTSSEHLPFHPEILPKLNKLFEPIIYSGELGHPKYQPACYKKAAHLLNVDPAQILFIDDSLTNTEAATEAGLQIIHYTDNQSALGKISKILLKNS